MTTRTLTIEEFLALPDTEPPSEFIRGEVIQKVAPSPKHAFLVLRIGKALLDYLDETREAVAFTEARHVSYEGDRVFLPDIHVTVADRVPRGPQAWTRGPLAVIPDFAVEVLSPDDRPGRVLDRITFYLQVGVKLIWIVDPDDETVTVYREGQPPTTVLPPAKLDAEPVLRAFSLDLGDLFGRMDEEIGERSE
jgi:Uma2 family endonuclease